MRTAPANTGNTNLFNIVPTFLIYVLGVAHMADAVGDRVQYVIVHSTVKHFIHSPDPALLSLVWQQAWECAAACWSSVGAGLPVADITPLAPCPAEQPAHTVAGAPAALLAGPRRRGACPAAEVAAQRARPQQLRHPQRRCR